MALPPLPPLPNYTTPRGGSALPPLPTIPLSEGAQAERAYAAGVPRAYRPDVAIQIYDAAQKRKAKQKAKAKRKKGARPKGYNPLQQKPLGRSTLTYQQKLAKDLIEAYTTSASSVSAGKILSIPGVGTAARIGGSGPFKAYAAGSGHALTFAGSLLDRVNRFGAPIGEMAAAAERGEGPLGRIEAFGTGLKRIVDNEDYKTVSSSIPKTGNPWIDVPTGIAGDVFTNPLSAVSRPITGSRKLIEKSIQAASRVPGGVSVARGRYLGRGEIPEADLPGLYIPPAARPPQTFRGPAGGPDLPIGRLATPRQVGRPLDQSPYPLGVTNAAPDLPLPPSLVQGPRNLLTRAQDPESQAALAGALTRRSPGSVPPSTPGGVPGSLESLPAQSLNRLYQRLGKAKGVYDEVAAPGVRMPSLGGAHRAGRSIGRKEIQTRLAARSATGRVNRGNKPISVKPRSGDPVGTQVPGLVGTKSRRERFNVAFGPRPSSPAPGARLPGGVTKVGARPPLRPTPPETFVPVQGTYRGKPVTQVERYQVLPTGGGYAIRDASQRKTYKRVFATRAAAIKHAQQLASNRTAGRRAIELAGRKGLPPRAKPRDVPYGRANIAALTEARDKALSNFRKALGKRIERGDLPENTVRRAGAIMKAQQYIESELLRIQKRLTLLRKTPEDLAEKGKLLRRKRELELELDKSMNKLAAQIGKVQGKDKDELLAAYEAHRAARDALAAATSEAAREIGTARKALRATVARKPTQATRTPTEGQRALLEPPGPPRGPSESDLPREIARIEATALQVLRAPYPLRATVQITKLRGQIKALEDGFAIAVGPNLNRSVSTLARRGKEYGELRTKVLQAENRYFTDKRLLESPSASFGQKQKGADFFAYSQMTDMANDIMSTGIKTEQAIQAYLNGEAGRFMLLPGIPVPIRFPALTARVTRLIKDKEPDFYRKMVELKDLNRDLFVTQYGPNKAVGAAARSVDAAVATQTGNSFFTIRQMVQKAGVGREELVKMSHYIETGEFADELSPAAKKLAKELQDLVEQHTREYLQAGGDLKRLGSSYVFHMIRPNEWDKAGFDQLMKEPDIFVYGNHPGFIKKRFDETASIRAMIDNGFDMEENLAVLTHFRLAAHHRAMGDLAISRAVTKHYGTKVRRKPTDAHVENGIVDPNKFDRSLSRDSHIPGSNLFRHDVTRDAFRLEEGLYLPEDVARTLLKLQYIRQANARSVFKKLRQANSKWKQWVLLTTGYDIRNQIGDMILASQSGLPPIRGIIRGILMLRGSDKVARSGSEFAVDIGRKLAGRKPIPRRGPTYKQLRTESEMLGVGQRGVIPQDVGANIAGAETLVARRGRTGGMQDPGMGRVRSAKLRGRRIRVARENVNRMGAYGQLVTSKKMAPIAAANKVNEALFDYGDVGSMVQHLRTSPIGMPFATWLAKNIPAQVKRLPTRANVEFSSLNRQLAEQSSDPQLGQPSFGNQADYIMERLALPIPGVNRFGHYGDPRADLSRLSPGVSGSAPVRDLPATLSSMAQQWGGDLGPLPQAIMGLITNRNPLTGADMRPGDKVPASGIDLFLRRLMGQDDAYKLVLNEEGSRTAVPATGAWQKWLTDTAMPVLGTLSRINKNDAPGLDRVGSGSLGFDPWQLLGAMGGVSTRPFWDKRQTMGALLSNRFEKDEAVGRLRKEMRDINAGFEQHGKGQPATIEQDENGFITKYEPASLQRYVVEFNRKLMKLLESQRIFDEIGAKG